MDTYDPDTAPDPKTWLELSETERLLLVGDYHDEFDDELGDDFSRAQLHASIHVVVEKPAGRGLRAGGRGVGAPAA